MSRDALRFWASAAVVAGGWTVAASLISSSDALRYVDGADRLRAWLLMLWTAGVLAICFGSAGLIGVMSPIGYREVADAGSVTAAIAARDRARRQETPFHRNFAWWLVVVGAMLVVIYFFAWGFTHA